MENHIDNHGTSKSGWWIAGIATVVIIVLALLALIGMMYGIDVSGGLF